MSILIVDDEPHMVHLLQFNLRKLSMPIHTASNGEEALRAFDALGKIHLLVIDYLLPDQDGLQVVSALKQKGHQFSTIMLTSRGQGGLDLQGVDVYMTKPFSPMELLAQARKLLKLPQ